jgi:DNA-binding NarL/FixJ family response regulator
MPISLCIVEDDRPTRESLVALLTSQSNFRCLNAYANAEAALAGIPGDRPDVAIVDINLPRMSGIECVAKLKASLPSLHVLMLTTYEESDAIFESLRAGANGYLLKKTLSNELIGAIEELQSGGAPMSPQIARKVVAHFHRLSVNAAEIDSLSTREQEILELLAKGCLYKQIGTRLGISYTTVCAHMRSIYSKLHVQTRTEATVKFLGQR